jgi:hypothetical protein
VGQGILREGHLCTASSAMVIIKASLWTQKGFYKIICFPDNILCIGSGYYNLISVLNILNLMGKNCEIPDHFNRM